MRMLIVLAVIGSFILVDCTGLIYTSTLEPTISLTP